MARRPAEDDDLPWLAEGVREAPATFVPRARLIGGGIVAVLLAALVGLGVYFASGHKSDGSSGYARAEDAPLIAADAGPYKVSPTDPGGAQITGIDDSVATVASGADHGSALAPDTTEEPLPRPGTAGAATETAPAAPPTNLLPPAIAPAPAAPPVAIAPAPIVAPKAPVAAPKPVAPKPEAKAKADTPAKADTAAKPADPATRAAKVDPAAAPVDAAPPKPAKAKPEAAAGSATLQLGAFSTRDKADAAWTKAGGDGALAGLTKRIEPVDRDGTTLYRLRAAGVASKAAAAALCGRIKAAGNACIVAE
jgi:cell division septation protein DedD